MERPPQTVIDYFYKLSDFNPQKRIAAARELLQNEDTIRYKTYVLDRLIKGLSSGKTGARIGFSTVLSVLLRENPNLLSGDEFLKLVDEKLTLKVPKKERAANALGQHLAFVSAYSGAVFGSSLSQLINRHTQLVKEVSPHLRLPFADAILLVLSNYKDESKKEILPSSELLELLKLVEDIERQEKNVDLYGRFSKEVVSNLDDESFVLIAKKVFKQEPWSYNRLVTSFGRRTSDTKRQIFHILVDLPEKTPQHLSVACSLVERLFKLNYHKGRIHDVRISLEDEKLVLEMFGGYKNSEGGESRTFQILVSVLRFIQRMTNEPSNQYKEDVKQAQSLTNLESDKCSQSLLDLCLSLNSRKLRLYRTLVLYVMTKEHRLFSEEDIQEAIKTIKNPLDDKEDDEFKPITEEERRQIHERWASEGEGEEDDESNEDDDSGEDENEKANPELTKQLKTALGRMAFENEESDGGQSDVEMDDEEMEELDRSLGAAFRAIMQQKKHASTGGPNKNVQWLNSLLSFKAIHDK